MPFKLPTQEEKAGYVFLQFEKIADRYDLGNDLISLGMHRGWKKQAVQALSLKSDGHYLDVCCGTGDLSLYIADRLGNEGWVTGVDFSKNMLTIAERRASVRNLSNHQPRIEWIAGDAQNLPFASDTFDGAIISFGLRNLSNLKQGLSEMSRVVKRGGKIVSLDLGHPTTLLFTPLYYFFFRRLVPLLGMLLQNDNKPYSYLPASLETYPNANGIARIFSEIGLKNITYTPLALGSVALHTGVVG